MQDALSPAIVIAGYAASGKTTLVRHIATEFDMVYVDLGSVVRLATWQWANQNQDNLDALNEEGMCQQIADELVLRHELTDSGLSIVVNNETLNVDDLRLREPFLDTETILLASHLQTKLNELQREVAGETSVVISARNGLAFADDEAVKLFVDPGMTTRLRRRAAYEHELRIRAGEEGGGKGWSDLDRQARRYLYDRVIGKELRSMELGVTIPFDEVEGKGFEWFRNIGTLADSRESIEELVLDRFTERGWNIDQSMIEGRISGERDR